MWRRIGFKITNCYKYVLLVIIAIFMLLLGLSFNPDTNNQINDLLINSQNKLGNAKKLYNQPHSSVATGLSDTTQLKQMGLSHTKQKLENCSRGNKLGECSVFSLLLQFFIRNRSFNLEKFCNRF